MCEQQKTWWILHILSPSESTFLTRTHSDVHHVFRVPACFPNQYERDSEQEWIIWTLLLKGSQVEKVISSARDIISPLSAENRSRPRCGRCSILIWQETSNRVLKNHTYLKQYTHYGTMILLHTAEWSTPLNTSSARLYCGEKKNRTECMSRGTQSGRETAARRSQKRFSVFLTTIYSFYWKSCVQSGSIIQS